MPNGKDIGPLIMTHELQLFQSNSICLTLSGNNITIDTTEKMLKVRLGIIYIQKFTNLYQFCNHGFMR